MNIAILCEGSTDAILLSYYLMKVNGWKYEKKSKIKIEPVDSTNSVINWYNSSDSDLMIWAVGGKDCFEHAIRKIIDYNQQDSTRAFERLVILTDRDKVENTEVITKSLSKEFEKYDERFLLKSSEWTSFNTKDSFGSDVITQIAAVIIPFDKAGALETFLLDALAEEIDNAHIINECRNFISSLKSEKYLQTERLRLKSELGVTFAIISPEKVFTRLDLMLQQVKWHEYKIIQDGFSIFDRLIDK